MIYEDIKIDNNIIQKINFTEEEKKNNYNKICKKIFKKN